MNLLECYIVKIFREEDVTEEYEKRTGITAKEPLLRITLTTCCYGVRETSTRFFSKSEWEKAKQQGYYLLRYLIFLLI